MCDKLLLKTQEPQGNCAEQGTDDPKQNVRGEHGVEFVPQGSEAFSAWFGFMVSLCDFLAAILVLDKELYVVPFRSPTT